MIARRAEELAPFMVMEVLERAREMERQGEDIIHLEVGEPDFDVPSPVKKATCWALTSVTFQSATCMKCLSCSAG